MTAFIKLNLYSILAELNAALDLCMNNADATRLYLTRDQLSLQGILARFIPPACPHLYLFPLNVIASGTGLMWNQVNFPPGLYALAESVITPALQDIYLAHPRESIPHLKTVLIVKFCGSRRAITASYQYLFIPNRRTLCINGNFATTRTTTMTRFKSKGWLLKSVP